MKVNQYLAISSKGKCRITKNKPKVLPNEIIVQLGINLPDSVFIKPQFKADITIPETQVRQHKIEIKVS